MLDHQATLLLPGARLARAAAIAALPFLPVGAANAVELPEGLAFTPEMRRAYFQVVPYCTEDAARLCSSVPPGDGRVTRCVIDHLPELSPVCRQKIEEKLLDLLPK